MAFEVDFLPVGDSYGDAIVIRYGEDIHRDMITSEWYREGNNRFTVTRDPIFNVSRHRGGRDDFSGIFWFDPFCEEGIDRGLRQVYGHCKIDTKPEPNEYGHLNLNYFDRNICYLFDTAVEEIVEIKITPMDERLVTKQFDREVLRKISGCYYNTNWRKGLNRERKPVFKKKLIEVL